jgi:hypothetical protein
MNDVKLVIREFMGKSGAYAVNETLRYSAFIENDFGSKCLDSWMSESCGYSELQYARRVLEPFSKILGVEITVEKI